jgi:hypothetical protein
MPAMGSRETLNAMLYSNFRFKYGILTINFVQPPGALVETVLMGIKMSHVQKTKESINNALAALEAETQEVVRGSSRLNDNLDKAGKKIWRQVLVICAVGLVLAISFFIVLNHKPVTTDQTHKRPVDQQAAGAKPGTEVSSESSQLPVKVLTVPPTSEQADLIKVLGQIREAQLQKDIHMFMEAYSPDFPGFGQKRETTLNIWGKFTYLEAQFKLTDLQQENPATIFGKVIWNMKVQDQKTGTMKIVTKSYWVTFSKQSGKWLVQKLEKIDSKSN